MRLATAASALCICTIVTATGACAVPLPPIVSAEAFRSGVPAQIELVHHKPGHVGGRGLRLGWYKKNRGKHKGWRRRR